MVYPRKKSVLDKFKEGSVPGTLFKSSESGWMNAELHHRHLITSSNRVSSPLDTLSETLALPQPQNNPRKRKPAKKNKTVCRTEDVLEELKMKEAEKKEQREERKDQKKRGGGTARKEARNTKVQPKAVDKMAELFKDFELSNEESDAVCPKCGLMMMADGYAVMAITIGMTSDAQTYVADATF
jgi:hypothetical protein